MKCGILTFHFAHNYGAVLQAYSLKNYLTGIGVEVHIINYVPEKLKNEYSLNPFARDRRMKAVVRRAISVPKRLCQYRLFYRFINDELIDKTKDDFSAVFFGSDQIWNDQITGQISNYYGTTFGKNIKKIAYAASFGSSQLSPFQQECVTRYLPDFYAIALREHDLVEEVTELSQKKVTSVLDPVFLLERSNWEQFAECPRGISDPYILYYALRNDPELIERTKALSNRLRCKVVCIHPIGNHLNVEWRQLYNVGPREFVYLIQHAEFIATNSFHAIAFSMIFSKRFIYKAYSEKESRVPSLLKLCRADRYYNHAKGVYDFRMFDIQELKAEKARSQNFIKESIKNNA